MQKLKLAIIATLVIVSVVLNIRIATKMTAIEAENDKLRQHAFMELEECARQLKDTHQVNDHLRRVNIMIREMMEEP